MNPQERTWNVTEHFFHPDQLHYYETILTIGNGYLGTRGTFEEGYPNELPSTLVHGIFNHHPDDLVPDLANIPIWFALQIEVDGELFRLDRGKVRGYFRQLDLRTGILRREVLWQMPSGQVVRLTFERFTSLADHHILAQQVSVTALDPIQKLTIRAYLDDSNALNGAYTVDGLKLVSHWKDTQTDDTTWIGTTAQSGYQVRMEQHVALNRDETFLNTGETIILTKLTAIATSRDTNELARFTAQKLHAAVEKGYDGLKAAHCQAWAKLWTDMDIQIEGDEYAQLAIRFATYHMLIAAPYHDEHVSIGAKTLSGPGYKGHIFWDTELFMLPIFTISYPKVARNLLMYRYHNLHGARRKAAEAGYRGSMFPWESTDTGEETTPRWTMPDDKGNRIRIWTGDNEQHISSDIAYAIWQYWQWTGDDDFMRDYGAEIILDTAVFWESRVEWNAAANRYELSQQIGPDEFHENINNSVYTNGLLVWHLEHALKTLDWLRENEAAKAESLQKQLNIGEANLDQWRTIINQLYIPIYEELGVFEQFSGYFDLNFVEVEKYEPRVTSMDVILGHQRSNASQVIKQADVVMLIALLGEALGSKADLIQNFEVYSKRTAHDSSLSPAIYAWVGARLGLVDKAYDFWMKAAGIDLYNNKGNVRDGIHAAACGGLREAVLFGFVGLQLDSEEGWKISPALPTWWKSVTFSFYYHGEKHHVTISKDQISINVS